MILAERNQGVSEQFLVTVKGLGERVVSMLEETSSLLRLPGWLCVLGQVGLHLSTAEFFRHSSRKGWHRDLFVEQQLQLNSQSFDCFDQ